MNIKKFFRTALSVIVATVALSSCVHNDDWETPPINCENRFAAPTMSLADLVAMAPATGTIVIPNGANDPEVIVDGYVVSNDESGNFYKTISFQDAPSNPTVGLQIEVDKSLNYVDFPVGTHIRLKVNGLVLGMDRGTIKLGSVDNNYPIGRIPASLMSRYFSGVCEGNALDIQKLTPLPLANLNEAKKPQYVNMLVTVPNVQFNISEVAPVIKTYLDYISGSGVDTDRKIEDNSGGSAVIRNSAFFSFGKTQLPTGSGDITFVVSKYNNNWQMLIRNIDDVQFTEPRFGGGSDIQYNGSLSENFESYNANQEQFPKYINTPINGNRLWQIRTFGGNKYIQLSANAGSGNYKTGFAVPVDLGAANTLTFKVNYGYYNGSPLKVYYTTNYTPGGNLANATLVDITSSFTMPTGPASSYGTLTSAGTYNIPANVTGNGFFVFMYEGANPGITTTAQIDDIVIN